MILDQGVGPPHISVQKPVSPAPFYSTPADQKAPAPTPVEYVWCKTKQRTWGDDPTRARTSHLQLDLRKLQHSQEDWLPSIPFVSWSAWWQVPPWKEPDITFPLPPAGSQQWGAVRLEGGCTPPVWDLCSSGAPVIQQVCI